MSEITPKENSFSLELVPALWWRPLVLVLVLLLVLAPLQPRSTCSNPGNRGRRGANTLWSSCWTDLCVK